jgi:stalled ribosome rescue protein Dom34
VVDELKTITVDVNVVDVNVVTRSMIIEYKVFQEKEPQKNKSIVDWEKEEKLKKAMVKTIQELQKAQITNKGFFKSIVGWNTMWPSMFNTTPSIEPSKP